MSNIYRNKISSVLVASAFAVSLSHNANAQSQPIVVLEYPNFSTNQQNVRSLQKHRILILQKKLHYFNH